jgi:hypothetical protein
MSWWRPTSQRDLRAMIALVFGIFGTVALTAVVVWIVWILWRGGWPSGTELARIDKIGLLGILLTVILGLSMVGHQLAINRRVLKGSAFGASFEASGGDELQAHTLAAASDALADKASEIAEPGK